MSDEWTLEKIAAELRKPWQECGHDVGDLCHRFMDLHGRQANYHEVTFVGWELWKLLLSSDPESVGFDQPAFAGEAEGLIDAVCAETYHTTLKNVADMLGLPDGVLDGALTSMVFDEPLVIGGVTYSPKHTWPIPFDALKKCRTE